MRFALYRTFDGVENGDNLLILPFGVTECFQRIQRFARLRDKQRSTF